MTQLKGLSQQAKRDSILSSHLNKKTLARVMMTMCSVLHLTSQVILSVLLIIQLRDGVATTAEPRTGMDTLTLQRIILITGIISNFQVHTIAGSLTTDPKMEPMIGMIMDTHAFRLDSITDG